MGRSTLFAVIPKALKADPAKFRAIINPFWHPSLDWNNHDQKVSEMFTDVLSDTKVYGYLLFEYSMMIEKLFRNLMEQNPETQKMEWHFEWAGTFPYCLSINRQDMNQLYAVKLILGKEHSVFYYDLPAEGEVWPMLNQERYLATYPKHMEPPRQMVDPRTQGVEEAMRKVFEPPPDTLELGPHIERVNAIRKLRDYMGRPYQ